VSAPDLASPDRRTRDEPADIAQLSEPPVDTAYRLSPVPSAPASRPLAERQPSRPVSRPLRSPLPPPSRRAHADNRQRPSFRRRSRATVEPEAPLSARPPSRSSRPRAAFRTPDRGARQAMIPERRHAVPEPAGAGTTVPNPQRRTRHPPPRPARRDAAVRRPERAPARSSTGRPEPSPAPRPPAEVYQQFGGVLATSRPVPRLLGRRTALAERCGPGRNRPAATRRPRRPGRNNGPATRALRRGAKRGPPTPIVRTSPAPSKSRERLPGDPAASHVADLAVTPPSRPLDDLAATLPRRLQSGRPFEIADTALQAHIGTRSPRGSGFSGPGATPTDRDQSGARRGTRASSAARTELPRRAMVFPMVFRRTPDGRPAHPQPVRPASAPPSRPSVRQLQDAVPVRLQNSMPERDALARTLHRRSGRPRTTPASRRDPERVNTELVAAPRLLSALRSEFTQHPDPCSTPSGSRNSDRWRPARRAENGITASSSVSRSTTRGRVFDARAPSISVRFDRAGSPAAVPLSEESLTRVRPNSSGRWSTTALDVETRRPESGPGVSAEPPASPHRHIAPERSSCPAPSCGTGSRPTVTAPDPATRRLDTSRGSRTSPPLHPGSTSAPEMGCPSRRRGGVPDVAGRFGRRSSDDMRAVRPGTVAEPAPGQSGGPGAVRGPARTRRRPAPTASRRASAAPPGLSGGPSLPAAGVPAAASRLAPRSRRGTAPPSASSVDAAGRCDGGAEAGTSSGSVPGPNRPGRPGLAGRGFGTFQAEGGAHVVGEERLRSGAATSRTPPRRRARTRPSRRRVVDPGMEGAGDVLERDSWSRRR